jgi:hypothetical protein
MAEAGLIRIMIKNQRHLLQSLKSQWLDSSNQRMERWGQGRGVRSQRAEG